MIWEILNKAPVRVLISLKESGETYAGRLSRESNITYAHIVKVIKILERNDLIEKTERGREKPIRLTDKGTRVASLITELAGLLGGADD